MIKKYEFLDQINFPSDLKKISEPKEVDIENPEILWLPRKLVLDGIYNDKFKGLTYATAALIWLLYQDER